MPIDAEVASVALLLYYLKRKYIPNFRYCSYSTSLSDLAIDR